MSDTRLVVGRIGRPHGIRGEVTVEVRTDAPDARFAAGVALATDPSDVGPLIIERARWHSSRLLLRFAGIDDRLAAEALRGTWLVVDYADLPPSEDPDEYHDQQLIGLRAETVGGTELGTVTDIRHLGQDLLVIRRDGGLRGDEVLVPFVAAIVPDVDLAAGRVVIDPPPGLLDEESAG